MRLLIFLFLFLVSLCPLFAEESDSLLLQIVTEEWKPYSYEVNGEVKGIATDIVRQVLDRAEIKYSLKVYPWARSYKMAQENSNVLIFAMVRTAERESNFQWIGQVAPADSVFLYRMANRGDIEIRSLEDASKFRVGVTRESDMHQFLESNAFNRLTVVSKLELSIKQLLANRIDFLCDSREGVAETLNEMKFDSSHKIEESLFLYELVPYLAANKNLSEEIALRLKVAYEELLSESLFESSLH